jgi:hypothetical protein
MPLELNLNQIKRWALFVLIPIFTFPFFFLIASLPKSVDFDQCKANYNLTEGRFDYTGLIEHLPEGVGRGVVLTVEGCMIECGSRPDLYPFATWTSTITTWVRIVKQEVQLTIHACVYTGSSIVWINNTGSLHCPSTNGYHLHSRSLAGESNGLPRSDSLEYTCVTSMRYCSRYGDTVQPDKG